VRVAAHVGEGLLRGPEEREPGLRGQLARRARDVQDRLDPRGLAEVLQQGGEPLRSGEVVPAQGADRATGVHEAPLGQPVGAGHRVQELRVRARAVGEQARALELDDEGRERVGQHVVHLAGEAPPLLDRGSVGLGVAGGLELLDEVRLLAVRLPEQDHEGREPDEDRAAELGEDDRGGGGPGGGHHRPEAQQRERPEDERVPRRDPHHRAPDRGEDAEPREPVALERRQRDRAGERDAERREDGPAAARRRQRAHHADHEERERDRDPEGAAVKPGRGVRPEGGDRDHGGDGQPRPAQPADRERDAEAAGAAELLEARPPERQVAIRGHVQTIERPRRPGIGAGVEAARADSTRRWMPGPPLHPRAVQPGRRRAARTAGLASAP
jgi:hypothetical protein